MIKAIRTICLAKHHHPSKSEAAYCDRLYAMRANREIEDYKWQVSVQLYIDGKPFTKWKIDFLVYENDGSLSWHECKGWNFSDQSFLLKRDAFLMNYPGAKLFVNWHPAVLHEKLSVMRRRVRQKVNALKVIRDRMKTKTNRHAINLKNHPRWAFKDGRIEIDYTK